MPRLIRTIILPGLLAASAAAAQQPKSVKSQTPAIPLATAGLAGQSVAVLPLTMTLSDPRLPGGTGPKARAAIRLWADSLLGDALLERATEVKWVLPPELRRVAGRATGLMPSPDQMGQATMRSPGLREMPDPLRTYVRQLVALAGGARYAFIPAALYLSSAPGDSLTVQLSAVLADARLGRVLWRTLAVGRGETATEAFRAALETILPTDSPAP
jgi:hypothetical protein